jgi:hypothetical protein
VAFSATSTCATDVRAEYSYWVQNPSGVWTQPCPWSPSAACSLWRPAVSGNHTIQVWVRRQGSSTLDSSRNLAFTVSP